jgi:DNA-binding CsgD family transcriptional regulator
MTSEFSTDVQRPRHRAGGRPGPDHASAKPAMSCVCRPLEAMNAVRTRPYGPLCGAWDEYISSRAAVGHTNKSTAKSLGLSVNTVGTHLRSVYAKLGVRSRVQLTDTLRRLGELP